MSRPTVTFENLPVLVQEMLDQLTRIEAKLHNGGGTSNDSADEPLTVQDAARLLCLAVPSIYRLVSNGTLPHYKLSKRIYFFKAELLDYIKQSQAKKYTTSNDQHLSIIKKRKS